MPGKPRRSALGALCVSVAATLGLAIALAPQNDEALAQRPHDEQRVLAHVLARRSARGRELETLRRQHAAAPHDEQAALRLVRAHIAESRRHGDPRPLGLAEAILQPLLNDSASSAVLVTWATIQQSRHQFEAALATLKRARRQSAHDAQALLTEATVLTVLGRYREAASACALLRGQAEPLYARLCNVPIKLMTGHAGDALTLLQQSRAEARAPEQLAWIASLECEARYWRGDLAAAQQACATSLRLAGDDRYTRALYCDVLLDAGKGQQLTSLVAQDEGDDALLLRGLLASLPASLQSAALTKLRAGFAADRERGEAAHAREEARLLLALGENEQALASAASNFALQHEPWDVRLLLEAALRKQDKAAAAPALRFMRETGFEAPRLRALVKRIEELP